VREFVFTAVKIDFVVPACYSGAHPASYPMDTAAVFPGLKWPERKLTNHPLLVATSRMRGTIPPPQYVFMARCLVKHSRLDKII